MVRDTAFKAYKAMLPIAFESLYAPQRYFAGG